MRKTRASDGDQGIGLLASVDIGPLCNHLIVDNGVATYETYSGLRCYYISNSLAV